jgi:hypothetical protein
LAQSYGLFDHVQTYMPTRTACVACGGVDSSGQPIDITCAVCEKGYTRTWVVQELACRLADVALVTQIFVSITPGVKVGDKILTIDESDANTLIAVRDEDEAYIGADSDYWRPMSVQPARMGRHPEWVVHLVKHTPIVTR